MTTFEQAWYTKYMNNMVTIDTLNKLANAGKLDSMLVEDWVEERLNKEGY